MFKLDSPGGGMARAVAIVVGILLVAGCSGGDSGTRSLSGNRLFEQNRPATVMVYSEFSARPKLVTPVLIDGAWNAMIDKVVADANRGTIPGDAASLENTAIELVSSNIFDYFQANNDPADFIQYDDPFTQGLVGSGFIVTSDGYVVTNAHLVAPGADFLKDEFALPFVEKFAGDVIDTWFKDWHLTDKTRKDLYVALGTYAYRKMDLGKIDASFSTIMGIAASGGESKNNPIRVDLVTAGDPAYTGSQKDVAILRMEGKSNLPTVDLGDDGALATGDQLYVLGYPGAATFSDFVKPGQTYEPSLTKGAVSGRKTMQGGWSAIQTDAATTHGNSGGPVFNDRGQVVGILTFGSIDPQTGNEVQGFNFLVPTSILKEYLLKVGIKPAESDTTRLYAKGLDAYDGGHYKIALTYFTQADNLFPGDEEIDNWKRTAARKVQAGADSTPFFYCWFNACPSGG
jgi:serine protease Do